MRTVATQPEFLECPNHSKSQRTKARVSQASTHTGGEPEIPKLLLLILETVIKLYIYINHNRILSSTHNTTLLTWCQWRTVVSVGRSVDGVRGSQSSQKHSRSTICVFPPDPSVPRLIWFGRTTHPGYYIFGSSHNIFSVLTDGPQCGCGWMVVGGLARYVGIFRTFRNKLFVTCRQCCCRRRFPLYWQMNSIDTRRFC